MTQNNSPSSTAAIDAKGKKNVVVLVMAQAILGAQMPMIFILGGLAGQSLASNICFATLPISMIILANMIAATPVSHFMQTYGRRAGFILGASFGAAGGAVAAYGLYLASFPIFLAGSFLTGVYMSAHGFYRFAAADNVSPEFKPKAISYVMAGGLAAALIGPQLVKMTSEAMVIPFLGTYLAVIAINVFGSGLFFFLDIPIPPKPSVDAPKGRTRWELITTPRIAVAVIGAMVSYALMNLVMTSTPLAVVGCGFERADAANIVGAHVLAMYVPSFFTGHIIARFGIEKVMATGLVILAGAGIVALQGVELSNFYIALILLGIGWNFGFIGATTLLSTSYEPHELGRMQGLNDLIVFGGVTVASLASGGLMNCSGGDAVAGWTSVNMAMAPFLVLAGGSLIWLVMRPNDD